MNNSVKKISVSIVNYNAGDFLLRCLESLEKSTNVDLDIYVVDNASSDNSLEKAIKKFPKVNFIKNQENLGFSKAHNQILRKIKTEFILILNPDTEVSSDAISKMVLFLEKNPKVGALTCKLVLENGKLDWASHRGFPTPLASFMYYFLKDDSLYHLSKKSLDTPHEVDAISGSFFMTRKSVLEKVGLFDEDYFMYAEDIDLCYRIKKAGLKIMYVPTATTIHHKGVSSGLKKHSQHVTTADLVTKKRSYDSFYNAMEIFYKKRMKQSYPFFVNWLVYLGINLKWFLAKRKLHV